MLHCPLKIGAIIHQLTNLKKLIDDSQCLGCFKQPMQMCGVTDGVGDLPIH